MPYVWWNYASTYYENYHWQGSLWTRLGCCFSSPLNMSWSARLVPYMVTRSFSATSRHSWDQLSDLSLARSIRMTPVLKPLPKAGQGEWDFQSLPGMYQSLWFSTKPKASCDLKSANSCHNLEISVANTTSVSRTMTLVNFEGKILGSVSLSNP